MLSENGYQKYAGNQGESPLIETIATIATDRSRSQQAAESPRSPWSRIPSSAVRFTSQRFGRRIFRRRVWMIR
jgi:hypothetical protein